MASTCTPVAPGPRCSQRLAFLPELREKGEARGPGTCRVQRKQAGVPGPLVSTLSLVTPQKG